MVLEFYGLREQPFGVTPNPRFMYASPSHREVLASLLYAVQSDLGFSALIADPGMGKTTLLFDLLERFRGSANTAFLFNTQCNSKDLVRHLLSELGVESDGRDQFSMYEKFKDVLLQSARDGKKVLLILDEAHNLDVSVLETVRLLSNFETSDSKLMHIILAGQSQLANKLMSPGMAQLYQRISIVSRLKPFTRDRTAAYINHRLGVAGYNGGPLFSPDALEKIASLSDGIPRTINRLCLASMSIGCALKQRQIEGSVVDEVSADLNLSTLLPQPAETKKKPARIRANSRSFSLVPEPPLESPAPALLNNNNNEAASPAAPVPPQMNNNEATPGAASDPPQMNNNEAAPGATPDLPQSPPVEPCEPDPILEKIRNVVAPQLRTLGKAALRAMKKAAWIPSVPLVTTALMGIVCIFLISLLIIYGIPGGSKNFANNLGRRATQTSAAANATGAQETPSTDAPKDEPAKPEAGVSNAPKKTSKKPVLDLLGTSAPVSAAENPQPRKGTSIDPKVTLPSFGDPVSAKANAPSTSSAQLSAQSTAPPEDPPTPPKVAVTSGDAPGPLAIAMGTVPSDTPNVKIGSPPPSPPPPKAEIVPGHVIQNPKPSYPEDAKRMGIAGPVVLSVVVSKDGKVKQVHRVSGDPRLARAAEEAVGRWKYSPYTLNGEPIEANTEITINFTVSPK